MERDIQTDDRQTDGQRFCLMPHFGSGGTTIGQPTNCVKIRSQRMRWVALSCVAVCTHPLWTVNNVSLSNVFDYSSAAPQIAGVNESLEYTFAVELNGSTWSAFSLAFPISQNLPVSYRLLTVCFVVITQKTWWWTSDDDDDDYIFGAISIAIMIPVA